MRPTMPCGVPVPVKSATAMLGQTRFALGPRHLSAPLAPFSATTSYAPQTTSGFPSPSKSTTAGDEYQPVSQYGPERQPPYCHMRTGALTLAVVKLAVTVVLAVRVRLHGVVPEQPPPLQPVNVDPLAGVAVRITTVPLV